MASSAGAVAAGALSAVALVLLGVARAVYPPAAGSGTEVTHERSGVRLAFRYEFTGSLDPLAVRLLGGGRPRWTQELELRDDAAGHLAFAAEASPRVLHGRADFSLSADGEGTVRLLEGELVVALPVVGGVAERRIVPGVLQRLDVEASALRRGLGLV